MTDFHLIDPPVGPYSAPEDIEAWLAELRGYPKTPEVERAIRDAEAMLKTRRKTK
jgi:hypothetical protein